jgi:RNA polymerase sigma factor FliA
VGIVHTVEGTNSQEQPPERTQEEIRELYQSTEDLVGKVLAHLLSSGIKAETDELMAFGRQGLLEAAQRFDPNRGEDFRRFAYFRVKGAMLDGLRKMGSWSRRGYERVVLLRAAHEASQSESHELGSAEQLKSAEAAARLRAHMAQVVTAMTTGMFAGHTHQHDGSIAAVDQSLNVEEELAARELSQLVRQVILELPPPEDDVIRRFYVDGQKMDDIAEVHGCSRSWVSRIHSRALKRMGAKLRSSA